MMRNILGGVALGTLVIGFFAAPVSVPLAQAEVQQQFPSVADLAERLLPWLRALSKAGVQVLIADPGRNYFPKTGVTKLATYSVPTSLELEDRAVRETSVYELQSS